MSACVIREALADEVNGARDVLENILASLRTETDLKAGEAALTAISKLFKLPWVYWVPDTSHPYALPEMKSFARACGWPDEFLKLWQNRHAMLKMPPYIRCRFEYLPFLATPSNEQPGTNTVSSDYPRFGTLIREMGVRTCLVVPLHLPKGQVAIVIWAGSRPCEDLHNVITGLEGSLLAIGHHFMRIVGRLTEREFDSYNEQFQLTPREWECMRTLAQGYRDAEIAKVLGISPSTTRFHLDNAVRKFGCKTRTQAVALLAQLGVLGSIECSGANF